LRRAAAPVTRDEERAIARTLIAEARKAPVVVDQAPEPSLIAEATALVDPDRLVEMIENQVVVADPGLLAALATSRSEGDVRKAIEILGAISDLHTASQVASSLFDRLGAAAPPEFRRELLEFAARKARATEGPGNAACQLARVADRWLDSGDADRGARLVREAQALAEKPREQPFPDPRDDLALALARVDLPSALKLLEGRSLQEWQLGTLRAGIAKRIAASDPAEARRLVGMIHHFTQSSVRCAVCLRMATKDLEAARALAAEERDPMLAALLPAMAAQTRATADPDGARAFLRESVVGLAKLRGGPTRRPAVAIALARLLPLAARIDPDRAPDYLWLALSLRPPLPALTGATPVLPNVRQLYVDLAELAVFVARYDRAAAEAVFAPVAARITDSVDARWGLGGEGPWLFRAAAAFDARVAKGLLDGLPEDPTPPVPRPTSGRDFRHGTTDRRSGRRDAQKHRRRPPQAANGRDQRI
jgi:hypothetical protein